MGFSVEDTWMWSTDERDGRAREDMAVDFGKGDLEEGDKNWDLGKKK